MFSKENKKTSDNKVSERNIVGKNTQITGDIISEGDFRIDGTLEGTIKTNGRVIIGESGFVKGKIECANADVEGKFSGELVVSNTLTVKTSANINGDVVIGKLSVEPGASFNATCAMKGAVKELNKDEQKTKGKTA
ncbi:polymer-forming cytoskeletal protein [Tenacibaculum sp. HL-MS23]|uniref:bactofilin family protein n=1 Tax=Tenacibaculum TaxID=104267 RepID=UPI001C4EA22D|nr:MULTISPECIES: polymer-forming cytoskeletal protein [Tenacibaculum]QXP73232.1 polymer-forming cytoskeletal protein [Tenacibaculum sp. AHE14PA]QXP77145.1 polymer-forming cytoskeletal protein [Tenacibaculum sp. AHE15PA]WNW01282.1 polymer-forming cytoskeletal protein [Tenacibaculum sp. HL-MS23]